jgi:hypothetical protein
MKTECSYFVFKQIQDSCSHYFVVLYFTPKRRLNCDSCPCWSGSYSYYVPKYRGDIAVIGETLAAECPLITNSLHSEFSEYYPNDSEI